MFTSDEETGGPGGKALAQLAVYLFTAALNDYTNKQTALNANSSDVRIAKSPGSKRSGEWDLLGVPGLRHPPVKKLAIANDELGLLLSTDPSIS